MKIGHPHDYYVQVFPDSWDQEPAEAAFYDGIFTLSLTMIVIRFVDGTVLEEPRVPARHGEAVGRLG